MYVPAQHVFHPAPLPMLPPALGSMAVGTACTFSLGPPAPTPALCPAFTSFCQQYAQDLNLPYATGCVGDSGETTEGNFISAYTLSCKIDGTENVATVFPEFVRTQLSWDGAEGPDAIPFSFIGCQIPP
ncbi:hypothetical protein ACQY0O_007311 [Thecaphora frezii]